MNMRSLSMRITLLVGVAAVVVIGLAALLMDHMVDAEMQSRFDASLSAQAQAMSSLAEVGSRGLTMDEGGGQTTRLLADRVRVTYVIRCMDGDKLSSHPAPSAYPERWMQSARTQPQFTDLGGVKAQRAVWFRFKAGRADDDDSIDASAAAPTLDCAMLMLQPRAQLDDILLTIDGILWLTPLLALLAVLGLSPLLVRRGLRPLAVLGDNMREIGPQALGQRLAPTGTRELEPLVGRFNEVLTRMDEGVMRERRFADALAHETRTRLAELRTLVEVEQRYPSGRPLQSLLDDVGSIGSELEDTVSGLLLLTRLDAGLESMEWRRIELDVLISRHLERIDETLRRRSLRVVVAPVTAPHTMLADPSLLDIVVGNLLGNAASYAPSGGAVDIAWDARSLRISNHAPDLDADEVSRFGQRYWSKHHGSEGHAGLGLSLAGAAAVAMGFELAFTLDADRRLHATLRWPSATSSSQHEQPGH